MDDLREKLAQVLASSRRGVTAKVNDNDRRQADDMLSAFAVIELPEAVTDELGDPRWRLDSSDPHRYARRDDRGRVALLGVGNPAKKEEAVLAAAAMLAAARHAR